MTWKKNFLITLLLFSWTCLHFLTTTTLAQAKPTSLPCLNPPPWLCPCILYSSSWKSFSQLSPPLPPLAIVRLLLITLSLVIFCLLFSFVDYAPVKGEIMWYLHLTPWLISLSIKLSNSSHAVPNGKIRAPSFSLLHGIPLCKCAIVFGSTHLLLGT